MMNETSQEISVEEQISKLNKQAKQYHWDRKQDLAIDCYKQILAIDPHNKNAFYSLIRHYESLKQIDVAINYYNKFLSHDSDKNNLYFLRDFARFAHRNNQLDLAAQCYQRILNSDLDEDDIADDEENLGIIYREQDKFDQAIECFQRVLNDKWGGRYSKAAFELGVTYSLQNNFDLAIDYFLQFLKQKPNEPNALSQLALVYYKQNKLNLAAECFENVLNQDRHHLKRINIPHIMCRLGLIYRELDQLDMAIECFQALIKDYPEDADAWRELSTTYEMLNREKTAELIRIGTLLSTSTLTTGLAHEIKNPLAGIQLTVSNLLSDLEDGTFDVNTLRADLLKIQSNASRINDRIGQARRLADDTLDPTKPPSTDMVEIKQLFQHTLEGFQQQLSIENITVELAVADNLPLIEANAIALEQVLANLISNAIDALRSQRCGTIRLAAEFVEPHMVITCHDTGMGIDVEDQRRIFEPLFTTKSHGQGTGIGLWLCKMIIEHWHGTIRFDSPPTQGTTFTVTLPLKQEES